MTEEYNLPEIFPFDESKLPELKERLKRKMMKTLLPIFIGVIALHIYLDHLEDIIQLVFMTITMMMVLALVMNKTLKKVAIEYKDYRIITNNKSITSLYRIE